MFTNVKEATDWLMSQRSKTDVTSFKQILDEMGVHYHDLKMIHVTGTNGKGSTVNYIREILNENGYKVGTFTSPYIVCHQDRFGINGKMVDDKTFLELVNRFYQPMSDHHLSMFEMDVLLAFELFYQEKVDYAIIEVGIGGSRDKTNVIDPICSVICNVGHDHLASIGPTLKDVAIQKSGIIKPNRPVFIGEMDKECTSVIETQAALKKSPLTICHPPKVNALVFDYKNYKDLRLGNVATYQVKNACMAIEVCSYLLPDINEKSIRNALLKATWPARFEHFSYHNKDIYLDGAHNQDALENLFESLKTIHGPISFIYSALRDKEYEKMANMILNEGYPLYIVTFEDDRALSEAEANTLKANGYFASIDEALNHVNDLKGTIVVCGSLHLVSQFREKMI